MKLNGYLGLAAAAVLGMVALSGCKSGSEANSATGGDAPKATGGAAAGGRTMPTATGNKYSDGDLKIGIVASLTGDQRPWGDDSKRGAEIAFKEFNDAGGLGGVKIQLLSEDSQSKPEPAKTAAEKLISDGVIGIIGEVASGHTEQIARSAFDKGVPVVAIGATKTTITDIGGNVFRVCYTDDFQGPVMAKFAMEEEGIKKIAIITDKKASYSQGLSESFKKYWLEKGGEVVAEVSYQTGDTQFQSQLAELKKANPQGIFMSGYFPEVGPLASQARAAGIDAKFFGGDGWDSSQILQSGGSAIVGGFLCNHYNNMEDRPEVKSFLDKYKAQNNGQEPGTTMAALGYDAAMVVIDALKRIGDAKKVDSKSLLDAIEATENLSGVTGKISLKGRNGNPPKRALVVEVRPLAEGFQKFRKAYEVSEVLGAK